MKQKSVVVVGGGSGTYSVLSGLKEVAVDLSAVITMMDSGGSTGRLRDQYGVLPPGDVRQALVALSETDQLWRELFVYRFSKGDLKGHTFGNLVLMALETISGSFEQAISSAQQILHTHGSVIPVTLQKTNISAKLTDGTIVRNEKLIDMQVERNPIKELYLNRKVPANPKAIDALLNADVIIVGPGDLFTSVIPNFLFDDIVTAYQRSRAKKICITNLMNKKGQTDNFKLSDHLVAYEQYLGKKPFHSILVNSESFSKSLEKHYIEAGETPVIDDLPETKLGNVDIIRTPLLAQTPHKQPKGDALLRSIARHDPHKLHDSLLQLIT